MVADVDSPSPLPASLRWAAWMVLGEAAAVALVAAFLMYADLTATATDLGSAVALTVFVLAVAAVLALLGANLRRRRAWPRGPAIALQLMLLPIAYYMTVGGLAWLGVPIGALGLVVAGLLIAPATREGLGIR
jgi:hypothetical protein